MRVQDFLGYRKLLGGTGTRLVNVDDYRRAAERRLPRMIFDNVDGGASGEVTLRANPEAFQRVTFRPRPFVDVSSVDQSVTVFGSLVPTPVLFAPAGLARLVRPEGEVAVARAAKRIGTVYALANLASRSIEEVAEASGGGLLWFQTFLWRDREITSSLVERVQAAGFQAICVTADVPMIGRKERDLRHGMSVPPRITPRNVLDVLGHPRWTKDLLLNPVITHRNVTFNSDEDSSLVGLGAFLSKQLRNPDATWEELAWLRTIWKGPLVVKGILTAEAARKCFELGADGVIVSNHGGRQLDGAPPSIEVLPEVVDVAKAAGSKEVFVDSGFRRGTDVVKALALGARAVFVGRPYLWALAAGGENGIVQLFAQLENEIETTLANLGVARAADLDQSVINVRLT